MRHPLRRLQNVTAQRRQPAGGPFAAGFAPFAGFSIPYGQDVICVANQASCSAQAFLRQNRGEVAMQDQTFDRRPGDSVSGYRILDSRENALCGLMRFESLEDVQDVLVAKGLVRRFRNGDIEITLGGIREVTRRPVVQDAVAEGQWEASPA